MIERIKQFIKQYTEKEKQKAEDIKQKEERLKQLEETHRGGLHPVQAMNDKKESHALRKEIKAYKEKQNNKKLILGLVILFVVLFSFIGIMASREELDESRDAGSESVTVSEETDTLFEEATSLEDATEEASTEAEIVMTENVTDAVVTEADSDAELTEPAETTTEVITTQVTTTEEVIITTTTTRYYYDEDDDDTPGVIVPDEEESEGNLVWVPTNGGTRYHLYAGCSDMIDPMQVSIETAINNGYTPCGRCY